MLGRKIYYELDTGDVILIVPEKHGIDATNTTKEQDFQLYTVLQARNPESVGVIQLEYGQMRGDFELANSVKVDPITKAITFNFPVFDKPVAQTMKDLQAENNNLKNENLQLAERLSQAELDNLIALKALAEVYEMLLALQV